MSSGENPRSSLVNPKARAEYAQHVMSFNVQQMLAAQGKRKIDFAKYMGMTSGGMSLKFSRCNWKLDEALMAADYLGSSVSSLTDDSVMRMLLGNEQTDSLISEINAKYQVRHDVAPDNPELAGTAKPRYVRKPDDDAPTAGLVAPAGPRFITMPNADDAFMIGRRRGYLTMTPIAVFPKPG